jgi:hypothetical protein
VPFSVMYGWKLTAADCTEKPLIEVQSGRLSATICNPVLLSHLTLSYVASDSVYIAWEREEMSQAKWSAALVIYV